MNWPQITIIILMALNVIKHIANDGEVKEADRYNAAIEVLASAVLIFILYHGGFFK